MTVLEDHGFEVVELRPGIDGGTVFFRALYGAANFGRSFNYESGFNHHIAVQHGSERPKLRNAKKLAVAGHLCFFAVKKQPPTAFVRSAGQSRRVSSKTGCAAASAQKL